MRGSIIGLMAAILGVTVISCTPSHVQMGNASSRTGEGNSCLVTLAGKSVFRMTLPPGVQGRESETMFVVEETKGHHFFFLIWAVSDARTVDEAVPRAGEIIKSQFLDFAPGAPKELTVAGTPAKQLSGPGKEADDRDPGTAEVILFTVDGHLFAACIHGEGDLSAAEHDFMMAAIQTARPLP